MESTEVIGLGRQADAHRHSEDPLQAEILTNIERIGIEYQDAFLDRIGRSMGMSNEMLHRHLRSLSRTGLVDAVCWADPEAYPGFRVSYRLTETGRELLGRLALAEAPG
jgi:DNA-binding HxlR family transcriptional regulator